MARRFEKVSFEQFLSAVRDCIDEHGMIDFGIAPTEELLNERIKEIWENIKLPKRATKGSAGYDFFAPFDLKFPVGMEVRFPTGIRVLMETDDVLKLFPRSGFGFKYRFQLNNTIGVIDSDYYYSDNEGHMFAKMICDSRRLDVTEMTVKSGEAYMQGIFEKYLVTDDDDTDGVRNGGLGSTTDSRFGSTTNDGFGSTTDSGFGSTTDLKAKSINASVKPNVVKKDQYKVGDKVVIKTLERLSEEFPKNDFGFPDTKCGIVSDMIKHFGNTRTISAMDCGFYLLAEDEDKWSWSEEMFEGCLVD